MELNAEFHEMFGFYDIRDHAIGFLEDVDRTILTVHYLENHNFIELRSY